MKLLIKSSNCAIDSNNEYNVSNLNLDLSKYTKCHLEYISATPLIYNITTYNNKILLSFSTS